MGGVGRSLGAAAILLAGCHGQPLGSAVASDAGGPCGPTPQLLVGASSYFGVYAGSEGNNLSLALGGGDLYLAPLVQSGTQPGPLMRVPTRGGPAVELASGPGFRSPPLVTATSLLVTEWDANQLLAVPLGGGAAVPLATARGEFYAGPVTDGTSVYFVDDGGLEIIPAAPAAAPVAPTKPLGGTDPLALGVGGSRLVMFFYGGVVESLALPAADGGPATALGTWPEADGVSSTIPCGAKVCWLAGSAIEAIDPVAGDPAAMAVVPDAVFEPSALLFDGTDFFVMGSSRTADATLIVRISPESGTAVIVVNLPFASGGLAVDDACVYFGTPSGTYSLLKSAEGAGVP
jgi:hypothetical protein